MHKQTVDETNNVSYSSPAIQSGANGERGTAMVIALLIMILMMAFVALALSRTSSETIAASNDEAETKAFEAANASLEVLTRNFNKIFETKLTISPQDITRIQSQYPPGFESSYQFSQIVTQTQATRDVVMTGEMFQGLYARRDEWQLDSTVTDNSGVQVALRRKFLNNRIPIFQFGIFYDDDLEFHPGPRFDFGGRVHTNGSIFLMASTGVYFSSKVSSAGHVFTDVSKNNTPASFWGENVFIKNASGNYVQLRHDMGSVLQSVTNGLPVTTTPLPEAYQSSDWQRNQNLFQGNLLANTRTLQLPIKLNGEMTASPVDLVEVIKRGKNIGDVWNNGTGSPASPNIVAVTAESTDDNVKAAERYYNKTGIRISIAESKAKLPGCAEGNGTAVTTPCGVRLEGDAAGQKIGSITGVRGYVPRAMVGTPAYQATAVNGYRFDTDSKEFWIKVETVVFNTTTANYDTLDITEDILSLGVTEPAPSISSNFQILDTNYLTNGYDSRSVIKLQRFAMPGPAIPNTTGAGSTTGFLTSAKWNGQDHNYVQAATIPNATSSNRCNDTSISPTAVNGGTIMSGSNFFPNGFGGDNRAHWKTAYIPALTDRYGCVVPFPINMFDTREGLYNDTTSVFNPGTAYGANVPWAGVMSMIDIDVANLRRFLNGSFDANMPGGTPYAATTGHVLRGSDIPQVNGWVIYVSDRRGDFDFDGEYDMEDVFGNNDGTLQPGEDINRNNILQAEYSNEAVRYTGSGSSISPDIAAVLDHKFYRRGVRLRNGQQPPGIYDSASPANTKGFTVASENGIYVQGNYNASGIASVGTPTAAKDYLPVGSSNIPSSIAGDAITVLSNGWNDAQSFVSPFTKRNRDATETHQRFAMLSGDTITSLDATPNQGGGDPRMNGGVHNFLRFLEDWGNVRLNYAGSMINLYNSHNNNGTFKCCNNVYAPPIRNWVFDATFLDVNRLPPGTPYFQNIQMTGFQRVN